MPKCAERRSTRTDGRARVDARPPTDGFAAVDS